MNEILKNLFLQGIVALATSGCKLEEKINPFNSDHLGDRSKYLGASEMASECALKPVLERRYGRAETAFSSMVIMAIGHMLESMVFLIFCAAGKKPQREVALYHPDLPWCRATVDFLWRTKSGAKFLELKSAKYCPDAPRTSYVNQLTLQMGLWLLLNPGQEVSGIVMVIDRACGHVREYPVAYDHGLFLGLVERAEEMWAAVQQPDIAPMPEPCPNGLCGFCGQRAKCPVGAPPQNSQLPQDLAEVAKKLYEDNQRIKLLETRTKQAKATLAAYANGRLKARAQDTFQLSVYQKAGRDSFNKEKLKSLLIDKGLDAEDVDTMFAMATTQGTASTTVEVKPL